MSLNWQIAAGDSTYEKEAAPKVVAHPEFAAEQAYISHAYECLERMRNSARNLQNLMAPDSGGTHQARLERDVVEEKALGRLYRLQLGSESLIFGRIDRLPVNPGDAPERFYIGRLPISDLDQTPIVVDWRAPVSEPFYRATGRRPLGLERRRHFATEESTLIGIDDEVFDISRLEGDDSDLVGTGALLAALGRARSGTMRDIVATIQAEQDEIIRAPMAGILVVQGGPGTGKTAVALHRASYLLYTNRFPLERQGVLVVGPNRTFIRYIARVLPALGETGVDLYGVDDMYADAVATRRDGLETARVKGQIVMAKVLRRAVLTRQRAVREEIRIGFGLMDLVIRPDEAVEMVDIVKRSHRLHNPSRKQLQSLMLERLYQRYRDSMARKGLTIVGEGVLSFDDVAAQLKVHPGVKLALDRMWPLLTPQMLLRDLYSKPALISAAARDLLSAQQQQLLSRDRGPSVEEVEWTSSDIALLDEAAQLLGPLPKSMSPTHHAQSVDHSTPHNGEEGLRTYGHIIIDETQDLSPMQLRMVARRSLNGSMTIVGDIGQATGMWAPKDWDQILEYLPHKRHASRFELTVGYRTPGEIMDLAAKVLAVEAPELRVPRSVRTVGFSPTFTRCEPGEIAATVANVQSEVRKLVAGGTIGVLAPDELVEPISRYLHEHHFIFEPIGGNSEGTNVLGVRNSKGLEFDGVILVEPAAVVAESSQGLRALYVALTRATQALAIVHSGELPECISSEPAPPAQQTPTENRPTEDTPAKHLVAQQVASQMPLF